MAIVNRDLESSEQLMVLESVQTLTVGASAASSFHVAQIPSPGTLRGFAVAANSVSGTPSVSVSIKRWSGAGVTTITYVGSTLAITAHGISTAYSSQMVGVTAFALQAGDVVVAVAEFAGGNVAVGNAVLSVIMKATQDIKQSFGLST